MKNKILSLGLLAALSTFSFGHFGCGGGGGPEVVGLDETLSCTPDLSELLNGKSSAEADSHWLCRVLGTTFKFVIFEDGTGYEDSIEDGSYSSLNDPFTWKQTGCRSLQYTGKDQKTIQINQVEGSRESKTLSFVEIIPNYGNINVSCDLVLE